MGELKIVEENRIVPLPKNMPRIKRVEMEHKPLMAVAMENPKIRNYAVAERNTATGIMIVHLLDLLGVGNKDKIDHHNKLHQFINEAYLNYTYQEIKLAFEKYVRGDYLQNGKPMTVYQEINSVIFGKVMREYEILKKTELDAYRRKLAEPEPVEVSEEEKEASAYRATILCFDEWAQSKRIIDGYTYIYDHIESIGLIKYEKARKQDAMNEAKKLLHSHGLAIPNKEKRESFIKSIEEAGSSKVILKAKRILLAEYFEKLHSKKIHIKSLLK